MKIKSRVQFGWDRRGMFFGTKFTAEDLKTGTGQMKALSPSSCRQEA